MNSTEQSYREEWAAKSGRPASEVYVPEALRTPEPAEEDYDAATEYK
jgi:hypothetical protein